MEEIKIWEVNDSGASELKSADAVSSESLLEKTLVAQPALLMPGMKLVGRQTPTEGGPLDLLGVDEDGRLVVFELKRGMLSRDAVAQVIDYASYLDSLDDDALAKFISRNSGKHGIEKIDDFQNWHTENTEADGLEALRPIRTVLVGLGVDDRTERMVSFLAKNSRMDISLLTFHGFAYQSKTLLARQARVESVVVVGDPPVGDGTREERWRRLIERAKSNGVSELFDKGVNLFRENWGGLRERPGQHGVILRLRPPPGSGRRRRRSYARVDPDTDGVRVVFFPRAIDLCPDEFGQPLQDISFQTVPRSRENNPLTVPRAEIQFRVTARNWETHEDSLKRLLLALYEVLQTGEFGDDLPDDEDDEDE